MATPTLSQLQTYAKTHLDYDGVSKHDFARALSELYAMHGMTLPITGQNGVDITQVLADPHLQGMMDGWANPQNRASLEPRRHLIQQVQEKLGVTAGEYAKNDQHAHDNIPGQNTLTKLAHFYAKQGQSIPVHHNDQIHWDQILQDVSGHAQSVNKAPVANTGKPAAIGQALPIKKELHTHTATEPKPVNHSEHADISKQIPASIAPIVPKQVPTVATKELQTLAPLITTDNVIPFTGPQNPLLDITDKLKTLGVKAPDAEPKEAPPVARTPLPDLQPIKAKNTFQLPAASAEITDHLADRLQPVEIKKDNFFKRALHKIEHRADKIVDGAVNLGESVFGHKPPKTATIPFEQENHNHLINLEGRNKYGIRPMIFGEERFPLVHKANATGKLEPTRWNPIAQHEVKHRNTLAGKVLQDVGNRAENTVARAAIGIARLLENFIDVNGDGEKNPKKYPREKGDIVNSSKEETYYVDPKTNEDEIKNHPGPVEYLKGELKKLTIAPVTHLPESAPSTGTPPPPSKQNERSH